MAPSANPKIAALRRIASHLLQREVDREEIGRLCSIAQENQIEASNYVLTVSRHWSRSQAASALQAMFLAATADSDMSEAKLKLLANMREILEMTDQEYQDAVESALQLDVHV